MSEKKEQNSLKWIFDYIFSSHLSSAKSKMHHQMVSLLHRRHTEIGEQIVVHFLSFETFEKKIGN